MKMAKNNLIFILILLACGVESSFATTSSVVQINVEGNAACNSLAINSVLQAKDSTVPSTGGSDTVTGPDGQVFQYSIGSSNGVADNTITLWNASSPSGTIKPVNFVIIKTNSSNNNHENNGGRAFFFNKLGVLNDDTEIAPAKITAVSFCYGLSSPVAATIPACGPSLAEVCTADPTRIVTIFDESTPNWRIQSCSCAAPGDPQFTECNPELQAGTQVPPGTPGPCTNSQGAIQFLPVEVQLGRDPGSYYCTVINGTRRCYQK